MTRNFLYLLAALGVLLLTLLGVTGGGTAAPPPPVGPTQAPGVLGLDQVAAVRMPAMDNAQLLAEELQRAGPGVAPAFAEPIAVDLTPANSGTWETLSDGRRLWRLRIQSPGAVSINLGFTRYQMPDGGQLLVYTPDLATVVGPFTAADNEAHGQLWTPLLERDEVVIEVTLPAEAEAQLQLALGFVNHGFTEFGKASILSGACNVDVVCSAADGFPQVDAWRDEIRSVAGISVGGSIFCSGFLVNNTAYDHKPYFITAYHCGITSSVAPSLVVYWNFQNSTCRQPNSPASGGPGDGVLTQFNTGSLLRAGNSPSDFTLVELDDPISEEVNAFWAGWDARPVDPTSAVGIHHPQGDEKRISFEGDPLTTTSYVGAASPGDGTHLRVTDWDLGTTEPGSSGSPLFNQDGRVVGQLHGGYAACGNELSDWYGRFSKSWTGGGTYQSRLSDWLDPLNTGMLVVSGLRQGPDFQMQVTPGSQAICAPQDGSYAVSLESVQGFSSPVALTAVDLPAGVAATFSANPVTPPGASSLTIGNTVAAAPGRYSFSVVGVAPTATHTSTVGLDIYAGLPMAPTLQQPADGALAVFQRPTFTWSSDVNVTSYTLEVAKDAEFTQTVLSVAGLTTTSYTPTANLAGGQVYYWRVRANNVCGEGSFSAPHHFTTAYGPGLCGPGLDPVVLFSDDFETGAAGWTHDGIGDSWALTTERVHSGAYAFRATAPAAVSDQRLVSPPIALPQDRSPLTLSFWNHQWMEDRTGGCFDGGMVEVSIDDGQTWMPVETGLLTDPYDGPISSQYGNPLAGRLAWCGDPQDWLNSIVDLDPDAGQTVRLRFRLGTDKSISREGWTIDDVAVQGCQPAGPHAALSPTSLMSLQQPDTVSSQQLTVYNSGGENLVWQINEELKGEALVLPAAGDGVERLAALPTAEELERVRRQEALQPPSAPLLDVMIDGSFEDGTPNRYWQEMSATFGTPLCSRNTCNPAVGFGPRTGDWWAWFGGVARMNEIASLSQTIEIREAPATLSFWLQIPTAQVSGTLSVAIDNDVLLQVTDAAASQYAAYTEMRVDASAYADGRPHMLTLRGTTAGGNGVTNFFVDDVALNDTYLPPCTAPGEVSWLSVEPTSGSTPVGATSTMTVTTDSRGLALGTYHANLCLLSNDANRPLLPVPVTLVNTDRVFTWYLALMLAQ